MSTEQYTPPPPTVPPPSPGSAFPGPPPPAAVDGDEELPGGDERSSLRSRVGRLGPRSLTARIVSGVVALVVGLVLAIAVTTYFFLRSYLFNKLDEQIGSVASGNQSHLSRCLNYGIPRCSLSDPGSYQAAQTEWLSVLNTQGTSAVPVDPSKTLQPMQLKASDARDFVAAPTTVRQITTVDGQHLLVSARVVNAPGGSFVVVSGLSTDELHDTLGRLVGIELSIGAGAVLITLFMTTYGVRFSLRRLRRVTTTAQEVATELSPTGAGLDRRVPDDEPDTEVGQLATSFNTMLSAVETQFAARLESEQRMRQFMADASHELRTPLTSIRGYAELARMQRAAGDTSDDNLDRIESEGTRMSRLVEDLLTLARGETDGSDRPVQRELIGVRGLLDDAASGSRAAFPGRQIDVRLQGEPLVLGDRDQLVRVVRNLVNNAAIHTAAERPILVSGFGDATGATIQVIDGGPGLSPDDAAHVFERFWRADKARTRARGGSGLGLSIVATIVRAHGGTVRFESAVGTGSTVTVTLPAAQPASD